MSAPRSGRPRTTSQRDVQRAAHRLFSDQGYAATSMAQIAAEAGISRTTLFAYVPTKSDLLWGDFEENERRALERLACSDPTNAVEMVGNALVAAADYPPEDHEGLRLRWRLAREDPELRAQTTVRTENLIQRLQESLTERRTDLDPAIVDRVLRALVAVSGRLVEDWARSENPEEGLSAHVADGLRPFLEAMQPLLPDAE